MNGDKRDRYFNDPGKKIKSLIAAERWTELEGMGGPAVKQLIEAYRTDNKDLRVEVAGTLLKIHRTVPVTDQLVAYLEKHAAELGDGILTSYFISLSLINPPPEKLIPLKSIL